MNKVAIVLLNYNMPERAEDIIAHVLARVEVPYELIVVDNGSDLVAPALGTNLRLEKNVQVSNGFRMGLAYADAIAAWELFEFFAYWFLITSLEFLTKDLTDPLEPLLKEMVDNPEVAMVIPSLSPSTNTAWENQKWRPVDDKPGGLTRETWGTDFYLAGLVRASWFNKIGRFNSALRYGWGICSEVNWMARRDGMKILMHNEVIIHKETNIGYVMDRMNMTANDRGVLSSDEMNYILEQKYGVLALDKLGHEFRGNYK